MSLVWVFVTLPGHIFFWLNVANGITNILLVLMIYLLCRIKRGFSLTVDEPAPVPAR